MVNIYKDTYFQGTLSDDLCESILAVRKEKCIPALKNCIYNLSSSCIDAIIESEESYEAAQGVSAGYSVPEELMVSINNVPLGVLRDAQTVAVAFFYLAKSGILGDEVGTGKTVEMMGLANILRLDNERHGKPFHFLFLTEGTPAAQIRRKCIQFTGKYVSLIPAADKKDVKTFIKRNFDGLNYSVVGVHSLLASSEFLVYLAQYRPFDLIIVDESHVVKNQRVNFYKSLKALFALCDRHILLNATPVELDAMDFYNQLRLIDKECVPSVSDFRHLYCKLKPSLYSYEVCGYKHMKEFKQSISLRYIARTRREQGAKYENNTSKTFLIPLSPVQKELQKLTSMHQMLGDYPPGVDETVPYTPETCYKLRCVDYILTEYMGDWDGETCLIYCKYIACQREMQKHLEDYGYRVVVLNGQTKKSVVADEVTKFNSGVYDIIITNIQRGLDINNCSTCIMYTIDPNPQKMIQFEGRITREFNVCNKHVYMLVSMGREKNVLLEKELKTRVKTSRDMTNAAMSLTSDELTSTDNWVVFEPGLMEYD